MRNKLVLKMCLASLFVSMAFVIDSFLTVRIAGNMEIGLFPIPIIIAGYLLGPVWGIVCGLISDILYGMLYGFPPSLFTIPKLLWGLAGGLIYLIPSKHNILKFAIFITIASILETSINTIALYQYFLRNPDSPALSFYDYLILNGVVLGARIQVMLIRIPILVLITNRVIKMFLILMDKEPVKT